jgi:hypothetical protein
MAQPIITIDAALSALASATTLGEFIELSNQAAALQVYARRAKLGIVAQPFGGNPTPGRKEARRTVPGYPGTRWRSRSGDIELQWSFIWPEAGRIELSAGL